MSDQTKLVCSNAFVKLAEGISTTNLETAWTFSEGNGNVIFDVSASGHSLVLPETAPPAWVKGGLEWTYDVSNKIVYSLPFTIFSGSSGHSIVWMVKFISAGGSSCSFLTLEFSGSKMQWNYPTSADFYYTGDCGYASLQPSFWDNIYMITLTHTGGDVLIYKNKILQSWDQESVSTGLGDVNKLTLGDTPYGGKSCAMLSCYLLTYSRVLNSTEIGSIFDILKPIIEARGLTVS